MWCAATNTLLAVRVCSVCKGEGGEIEGLVPIILRHRPVRWVSEAVHCSWCRSRPHLLSQRWLTLEVWAPLNLVLVACHRFKRIQQADPVCLPEILIHSCVISSRIMDKHGTNEWTDRRTEREQCVMRPLYRDGHVTVIWHNP